MITKIHLNIIQHNAIKYRQYLDSLQIQRIELTVHKELKYDQLMG